MSQLKRIIFHWTAGTYTPSEYDKKNYHYLIDGSGKVLVGKYPPEANISLKDGKYAAHTLNSNTGSIGISVCCMGGNDVKERPLKTGKYPLNQTQWNALIQKIADLCQQYDIKPTMTTVLSHAEVTKNLGIKQNGKWDITYLPGDTAVRSPQEVGNVLRKAVSDELTRRAAPPQSVVKVVPAPTITPVKVAGYLTNLINAIFGIKK